MKKHITAELCPKFGSTMRGHWLFGRGALGVAAIVLGAGCAGAEQAVDLGDLGAGGGLHEQGLSTNGLSTNGLSTNGLSTNGLSTNGLSTNGLSTNGLSTNGLSTNGLSTNGFEAWFASNPAEYSDAVMRYVVRCAAAEGEARVFVASDGKVYTWQGAMGLAPKWSAGEAIPVVEQQLVSACLAAHVNRYGLHVAISIRGEKGDGELIDVTEEEEKEFVVEEGCFFGNLFSGEGVWTAPVKESFGDPDEVWSSSRACAHQAPWDDGDCAPFLPKLAGTCADHCTGYDGETKTFAGCSAGGVEFAPLTVSLRESEVNLCGDGICQASEVPWSDSAGAGCDDCGIVP